MANLKDIKKELETVDSTKIFFVDFNGRIMSLPVNLDNIQFILENGIGFDGSSIAGYGTVDRSDRLLFPDPDSFKVLKFSDETVGFFIASIYNEKEKPAQADPRAILKKILDEAEREFGFKFLLGPEHEFFLLKNGNKKKNLHTDQGLYFQSSPHDKGEAVRNRIVNILKGCGIAFEKAHHEVTPSQHEVNLEPTDPLNGADRTVLFNYVTQKTAEEFGYRATFMPKPFAEWAGNGLHLHLSLWDKGGTNDLSKGQADDEPLSPLGRHFVGGLLSHAHALTGIGAPTLLHAGTGPYEHLDGIGRNRWGDYSATVVDPTNPYSFWTFQEFAMDGNQWGIRVTQLILAGDEPVIPEPSVWSFSMCSKVGQRISLIQTKPSRWWAWATLKTRDSASSRIWRTGRSPGS